MTPTADALYNALPITHIKVSLPWLKQFWNMSLTVAQAKELARNDTRFAVSGTKIGRRNPNPRSYAFSFTGTEHTAKIAPRKERVL